MKTDAISAAMPFLPQQLAHALLSAAAPILLDVRRAAAFEKNPMLIAGAVRVLPEQIEEWAAKNVAALSRPVVTYCVYGHEVSQGAAEALRGAGFGAVHLEGGISAWQAEGRVTLAGGAKLAQHAT